MSDTVASLTTTLTITPAITGDNFHREWDTQYWVPVTGGKHEDKIEKLWAMQTCEWDKEAHKLIQDWHIVDKRYVKDGVKDNLSEGGKVADKDKGKGDDTTCMEFFAGLLKPKQ